VNKPEPDAPIVRIPYDSLAPATLDAVIEEFVTREGTDYGATEVPLRQKIEQVRTEVLTGRAVILFDTVSRTCNIVQKDDPRMKTVTPA